MLSSGRKSPASPLKKRVGIKSSLDPEELAEIKEAFQLFDTAHNNQLDHRELKAAIRALGFEANKRFIRQVYNELGKDLSQPVSYEEFLAVVEPKIKSRDFREETLKLFRMFDDDNTGRLTFKNLRRIANELGESLTDAELQDMIEEVDRSGEGSITFDDFFRVMNKKEGSLDDFSDED